MLRSSVAFDRHPSWSVSSLVFLFAASDFSKAITLTNQITSKTLYRTTPKCNDYASASRSSSRWSCFGHAAPKHMTSTAPSPSRYTLDSTFTHMYQKANYSVLGATDPNNVLTMSDKLLLDLFLFFTILTNSPDFFQNPFDCNPLICPKSAQFTLIHE